MRAALQTPLEKIEQMGKEGATRVASQHNVVTEAHKLADLFRSYSLK
jgi:hypothetical protein